MLTYTFENRGKKSYYQHLYEQIREDILSERLPAETKLPSKRSFAKHLGLSVMTIESAYEQLMVEGYIYSREKRGYYVSDISKHNQFLQKQPYQILEKEEEKQEENSGRKAEEPFMDFTSNRVNLDHFPMATWSKLMRKVLSEQASQVLSPSEPQGIWILRKAIAHHLYHFRGMAVSPEQIVIGAGTEYLYQLLIQLLGRDKIYGMENPGYGKLARVYDKNNVTFRYLDLDEEGLSVDALRREDVQIVHTSPSHHFPTGIVMPIRRRQELLNWAANEPGRYIIEDDYDCEFRLSGLPIPTLQSIDGNGKVIYLNTFSKSLTPSVRISYMVLPEELLETYQSQLGFYACTVSNFEQYTLAAFLQEGYFEKHINRMRNYYKNKRNTVIRAIRSSSLADKATILEEDAGLHFLLRLDTGLSDEELKQKLEQCGIRMNCLADYSYYHNPYYAHMFVINYTGVEEERLEEAMERISRCL